MTLITVVTASGLYSAPASADGGPDLVVPNIALSPAEPAIDDAVTITVTVKNQGTAAAGQSYVVGYIDSAILATVPVNQLGAGTMATVTFTWKAEPGSHTVKAEADATNIITETNETNNSRTYAFTTLAADLVVQTISWLPAGPSRGDSVTISVVIKNQGSAASRGTSLNLYIDGSSRGIQDVSSINPSGTLTRTYNWVALSGQHTVRAVIDEANTVREGNDANNEKTTVFATAAPDLLIEKIAWAPVNPSKNDTVSINATVKNQGIGRSDACHISYTIDGELKSSVPVSVLEAGASVNVTYSWNITGVKHDVKTVVDCYQIVTESDESNNERAATINTLAPDLTIASITWAPINAAVGDTVSINVTVANYGAGRSEATRAACYIDGSNYITPDVPEINASATAVLAFTWLATGGSHAIGVHVDHNNTLAETNEENNKLTVNISIVPPDLVIPTITWTPDNFGIDDMVTFHVNVKNQGSGRAEAFNLAAYLDGILIGTESVDRIETSTSVNRTFTWKALNGRHTFKAVADSHQYLAEENENNNEYTMTIAPNMPDISVETVTWSPADIKAGSETTFDINIKNLGTLSAGPTRVAYYVDKTAAGYTDIGQLDAGASIKVQFIWDAMAGLHGLDIVADSSNKVFEIDEANNTKTVSVPPPDLVVPDITWSPPGASTGEKVFLSATIKNQGAGWTQVSQIICYVDGVALATADLPELDAGASVTKAFEWKAAAGKHRVKVTADIANRVTESNETNNDREVDFGTLTPDLVIKEIGWIIENPLVDNKVIFTIPIKNQGTGNAATTNITYAVDKFPAVTAATTPLPAGDTAVFTFSLNLELGPHAVVVTIDSGGKINELDETNNTATLSFTTVAPDLTIKSITLAPAAALPGDDVTVTVKMENKGREKVPNAKLSLSVDNVTVGAADFKEIDIGAVVSQDFRWKAVAGNHEIIACADIGNLVVESNETNNAKTRAFTIEKPATTTALPKPTNLSKASPADKGFLASWWWLLLLVTAVLGGAAFISMLRSFRKG